MILADFNLSFLIHKLNTEELLAGVVVYDYVVMECKITHNEY